MSDLLKVLGDICLLTRKSTFKLGYSFWTTAKMGKDHPDADLHPEATGPAAAIVKVTTMNCIVPITVTDMIVTRHMKQRIHSNSTQAGSAPSSNASGSPLRRRI